MCFSPSASFGAGIALTVIGVAAIRQAKRPHQLPFALIPLIFAAQQLVEGVLWISLTGVAPEWIGAPATYAFLFFAQVIRPFWVPYSIFRLDGGRAKKGRRKAQNTLTGIGVLVALYLAFCLIFYPVEGKVIGSHISYQQDYPSPLSSYGGLLYLFATILPPFFSNYKGVWSLGVAILLAYLITLFFYESHIVSVWCYFAAMISAMVWGVLRSKGSEEAGRISPYRKKRSSVRRPDRAPREAPPSPRDVFG